MRLDSDRCLYAEDSFYVQFKSASEKEVVCQGHEVLWLQELKLPLFIGRVDISNSSIELYAAHRITQFVLEGMQTDVHLILVS